MLLYSSKSLDIFFEHQFDRCILNWKETPESIALFKKDILSYVKVGTTYLMKQAIWYQEKLTIPINEELGKWIEENMNEPFIQEFKNRNYYPLNNEYHYPVALVIGAEAYNLFALTQLNEKTTDITTGRRKPKVFANRQEAKIWLDKWQSAKPNYNHQEELKGSKLSPKIDSILKTHYKSQLNFLEEDKNNFNTVTRREKEIITYLLQGKKVGEIALLLCISVHTVRTHWKNIKKKLQIKSVLDFSHKDVVV
ncbi:response regulator transcription factor [Flammeovirga pectinis]|uniref:Response regulator transcription factor n=1 Tax=Flammeovirga pectinis TaxID=2494373 RepID=A0A3Q9FRW2_9BACT|nr:LuxR C-terminal-related transcriptional regulator [Flammeovirga pectinis]AZQ64966.1 response regulator transcription factor [Flammeovirga pectinis]